MVTGPSTYVKNIAPEKLELLIAIVNAPKVRFYTNLIQSSEANLYLAVQASVVREDKLKDLLEVLDENFSTIKDGGGIAITVPLTSVIGTLVYGFLSNDKRTIKQ